MRLDKGSLEDAVRSGILAPAQADALWSFLSDRQSDTPSFKPAHILYYLGGLIAIGALTLFMTLGWERFGGAGLLVISVVYCFAAVALTELLLLRRLALPAGITAVLAIATIPLAVYALQHVLGYWPAGGAASAYRDAGRGHALVHEHGLDAISLRWRCVGFPQ